MPNQLETYHYVWLGAHPQRTEEWLRRMLAEGFDVHHLDGVHTNDAPSNLLLIETHDHNEILHRLKFVRVIGVTRPSSPAMAADAKAKEVYEALVLGRSYSEIVRQCGVKRERINPLGHRHADRYQLPWPPPACFKGRKRKK